MRLLNQQSARQSTRVTSSLLLVLVGVLASVAVPDARAGTKKDGAGAFSTRHYRNLFAELGHSKKEISTKIDTAYQQLFHGDPETQSVVFSAGKNANGPLAYLTDWNNHDVRTEGMSYGMMISVELNQKAEFDALWNWAKTYMYIDDPHHPSYGYFSWSCKTDGTPNEETAAPDGEEYFVMSLYFAAARWGNGPGIYNYRAQADQLLTTMRHREVITGPTRFGMRSVGNEVDEEQKMIRFVPVVNRGDFTDPSYHLPAFYELWARWGPPADREFWAEAAEASRAFFVKTTDPQTGLAPAYANFDGTPHPTRFSQSTVFGYDSWRTASNWIGRGGGRPRRSSSSATASRCSFERRGYRPMAMSTRSRARSCHPAIRRACSPPTPWPAWQPPMPRRRTLCRLYGMLRSRPDNCATTTECFTC
jgi:oligosaccharide reducing-end xylanase